MMEPSITAEFMSAASALARSRGLNVDQSTILGSSCFLHGWFVNLRYWTVQLIRAA